MPCGGGWEMHCRPPPVHQTTQQQTTTMHLLLTTEHCKEHGVCEQPFVVARAKGGPSEQPAGQVVQVGGGRLVAKRAHNVPKSVSAAPPLAHPGDVWADALRHVKTFYPRRGIWAEYNHHSAQLSPVHRRRGRPTSSTQDVRSFRWVRPGQRTRDRSTQPLQSGRAGFRWHWHCVVRRRCHRCCVHRRNRLSSGNPNCALALGPCGRRDRNERRRVSVEGLGVVQECRRACSVELCWDARCNSWTGGRTWRRRWRRHDNRDLRHVDRWSLRKPRLRLRPRLRGNSGGSRSLQHSVRSRGSRRSCASQAPRHVATSVRAPQGPRALRLSR